MIPLTNPWGNNEPLFGTTPRSLTPAVCPVGCSSRQLSGQNLGEKKKNNCRRDLRSYLPKLPTQCRILSGNILDQWPSSIFAPTFSGTNTAACYNVEQAPFLSWAKPCNNGTHWSSSGFCVHTQRASPKSTRQPLRVKASIVFSFSG